jgi:predicted deacylase
MLIIGQDPRRARAAGEQRANRQPRRVVCITARVHPGETPASYMCHGLIELLISNDAAAKKLRNNITFIIVPMLNPDGVFLGNYRTAFCGLDLNRQYDKPTAWCTPENLHLKEMLKALAEEGEHGDAPVSLDFVIDLHSHSTAMNAFCYINLEENDTPKMQSQLLFLRLLSQENAHFSLSASRGVLHMHALHMCVCVSSRAAAVATHELHLFCCA